MNTKKPRQDVGAFFMYMMNIIRK